MADFGPPIYCTWDGESLVPVNQREAHRADKQLVVGERYWIGEYQDRSHKSHNHYYACLHHAWLNLPEEHNDKPYAVTQDHLRKHALIMTHYCQTLSCLCKSEQHAKKFAADCKHLDDFVFVSTQNDLVICYIAESQSYKAMGKKRFEASKQAVLEYVAHMVGISVEELTTISREAA